MQENEIKVARALQQLVPEEKSRRIFAKVFDAETISTVHALAQKGYFNLLEFVISTGKEAHVFRATDVSGNYRAVKIYRVEASDFKNMQQYLEGDRRFKQVKKKKRDIVYAWTKKEFKNLSLANSAGARVPLPIAYKNNVLVMEFIGENGIASPSLQQQQKDRGIEGLEIRELYEKLLESLAKMLFRAKIVHSDLSEYNILIQKGEPVIIDMGQAVIFSHPKAKEFFERDLRNLSNYFSKKGLKKTEKNVENDIKALKTSILPQKE